MKSEIATHTPVVSLVGSTLWLLPIWESLWIRTTSTVEVCDATEGS